MPQCICRAPQDDALSINGRQLKENLYADVNNPDGRLQK